MVFKNKHMSIIFDYSTLENKQENFVFPCKQKQFLLLQWTITLKTYTYTGLTNLLSVSIQTLTHMLILQVALLHSMKLHYVYSHDANVAGIPGPDNTDLFYCADCDMSLKL